MSARLKSSVLRREERGFGSISMGRLIASGMFGGVVFMLVRLAGMGILMIPGGFVAFILGLIFTSKRHGIPLYLHLFITMRARFILTASMGDNLQASILAWLNVAPDVLMLDTAQTFATPIIAQEESDLSAWEIVPDSALSDGLEIVQDTLYIEK
jgi:hypothetical protein